MSNQSFHDEADYKRELIALLSGQDWLLQAHEDKLDNFIPDLSFSASKIDGWIEVKWQDKIPPSLNEIHHWTWGQQTWLERRGEKGAGNCFLLVGTPEGNFLWHHAHLSKVRYMKFHDATGWCFIQAPRLNDLVQQMETRLRG